jgi:hypothetical protein
MGISIAHQQRTVPHHQATNQWAEVTDCAKGRLTAPGLQRERCVSGAGFTGDQWRDSYFYGMVRSD